MIISSAIRLKDGRVFVGKHHADCYYHAELLGVNTSVIDISEDGFLTDDLQFIDRYKAYTYAFFNGQCKAKNSAYLLSEDLW